MVFKVDGVLAGCSLLMFLPNTLQSLYFWWDPEIRGSGLGYYSQLVEIEMMRTTKNLIYYDLLWHCPVSSKMAYKMNLAGQQICCPFTLRWQLYDKRIAD